ncbi:MAG: hypothetical protein RL112_270 [Planctomycetota bacterium]|jgi:methylated-DNA-[protein]-cysteine S-methyltransferase
MARAASRPANRAGDRRLGAARVEQWRWCVHDTWLGPLLACAGERGLVHVGLAVEEPEALLSKLARRGARQVRCLESRAHLARALLQLDEYFAGRRAVLDHPLDCIGSPFELRVWEIERGIPRGATRTYGELARELGASGAARAVGGATGRNPLLLFVPCHRVLSSNGLGGFSAPGGAATKARLLSFEGAWPAN